MSRSERPRDVYWLLRKTYQWGRGSGNPTDMSPLGLTARLLLGVYALLISSPVLWAAAQVAPPSLAVMTGFAIGVRLGRRIGRGLA